MRLGLLQPLAAMTGRLAPPGRTREQPQLDLRDNQAASSKSLKGHSGETGMEYVGMAMAFALGRGLTSKTKANTPAKPLFRSEMVRAVNSQWTLHR